MGIYHRSDTDESFFTDLSQLVELWIVFEDLIVQEDPADHLLGVPDVPAGQFVAVVRGVQGVRLLPIHVPKMKSLFDAYSWALLVQM